jgi:hypothetical protein
VGEANSQGNRPEPMVFDLVDPLGAPPNKSEVNTLLDYSPRDGKLEWSPEVEYSFAKGHSIEFELPLENTAVKEYKVLLRVAFGKLAQGRMLQAGRRWGGGKMKKKRMQRSFSI